MLTYDHGLVNAVQKDERIVGILPVAMLNAAGVESLQGGKKIRLRSRGERSRSYRC